jgi:hypothetical protein
VRLHLIKYWIKLYSCIDLERSQMHERLCLRSRVSRTAQGAELQHNTLRRDTDTISTERKKEGKKEKKRRQNPPAPEQVRSTLGGGSCDDADLT